jgi:uncharacterized protein YdeI (YjbR/CyaY-like superfamily)
MPEDFLAALSKEPHAQAFFETLNKSQRYSFFFASPPPRSQRHEPNASLILSPC